MKRTFRIGATQCREQERVARIKILRMIEKLFFIGRVANPTFIIKSPFAERRQQVSL